MVVRYRFSLAQLYLTETYSREGGVRAVLLALQENLPLSPGLGLLTLNTARIRFHQPGY